MFIGRAQRGEVRWEGELGRRKKKMAEKGQRIKSCARIELRAGCKDTRGLTHHQRQGAQECGLQLAPNGRSRSYPRCKCRRTLDDNTGRRPCALQRARRRDGGAAGTVARGRTKRRINHTQVTSPSDIRVSKALLCTETCTLVPRPPKTLRCSISLIPSAPVSRPPAGIPISVSQPLA